MSVERLMNQQDLADEKYKEGTNRIGLWLFIVSDSFVFLGLLVSRIALWGNTRPELNPILGLVVTVLLLVSSFFIYRGESAMSVGDRRGFIRNTLVTLILGIIFLVGVVGIEWQIAPFKASTDIYGAVFYMMTGMHAFHVLTGVIFLLVILNNGRRGHYSLEKHWAVEAAATYWHFIDVVWVFFYPALYLIGTLVR